MKIRELTLSIAVLLSLTAGCSDDACHQSDVEQLAVPEAARLNGVAFVGDHDDAIAIVGDDGLVAVNPEAAYGGTFTTTRPVEVDLHGVTGGAGGLLFAVGDAGTLIGAARPGGAWQTLPSGTTADLWAIAALSRDSGEQLLAVGDEVILHRDPLTSQWAPLPAPDGGWGHLRAIVGGRARIYAVGLGGTVWSTLAPGGAWSREDTGSTVDFHAATVSFYGDDVIVVGASGTALRRNSGWKPLRGDLRGDLIAADGDHILAADGHVYRIPAYFAEDDPEDPVVRLAWSVPGARTLREGADFVLVGEHGLAAKVGLYCYGRFN